MADQKTEAEFSDAARFNTWLSSNFDSSPGIWMRIAKKGAPTTSVNYQDALDVALVWGWIDGQKKSVDEFYWLQAFTPRRARSVWSKRNVEKCKQLIADGTMQPSGLAQVEAAKADGRWDRAYEGSAKAIESPEWLAALDASPKARAFYDTLNSANRFAFYYRIQDAKREETRLKRIETYIAMLERGEALYLFAPKRAAD